MAHIPLLGPPKSVPSVRGHVHYLPHIPVILKHMQLIPASELLHLQSFLPETLFPHLDMSGCCVFRSMSSCHLHMSPFHFCHGANHLHSFVYYLFSHFEECKLLRSGSVVLLITTKSRALRGQSLAHSGTYNKYAEFPLFK